VAEFKEEKLPRPSSARLFREIILRTEFATDTKAAATLLVACSRNWELPASPRSGTDVGVWPGMDGPGGSGGWP